VQLIQILLPLTDNDGVPFPDTVLRGIQSELAQRFGGVTAFSRAPALGIWNQGGTPQRDDIIVVEVMAESLDPAWWRQFRLRLQHLLRQELVVIRAQMLEML
jgi:hypothetical protein